MGTTSESSLRREDTNVQTAHDSPTVVDAEHRIQLQDLEGIPKGARNNDSNESPTEDGDTIVAQWDGEDDPANPHNWPAWTINSNAALIAFLSFLMPLASCEPHSHV